LAVDAPELRCQLLGAGLAKLPLGREMGAGAGRDAGDKPPREKVAPGAPPVKPRCGDALRLKNRVWAKLRPGTAEARAVMWLALMLSLVGSIGSLPEIARACRNSCRPTDCA